VTYLIHLASSAIASVNSEVVLIALLVVAAAIVLEVVWAATSEKKRTSGFGRDSVALSVDGSDSLPARNYVSDMQGLAGKPDALIVENGFIIPVERKPLAKKIHDRYVAQLLVYMRLVEEFEGKKPPYGYLILGPNCRRFKVENTPEKQAWLQGLLDEMRGILERNEPSKPTPHPRKCRKCDVRDSCAHAVITADTVRIGERKKQPTDESVSTPSAEPLKPTAT
jgi:CRISPR-associated exonuclease Cas4